MYAPAAQRRPLGAGRRGLVDDTARATVPAGPVTIGTDAALAYDNERPAHRVQVGAFAIDRHPVTARRYDAFVADGGYARPELWTERGWTWLGEHGHRAPQGWTPDGAGGWTVRRFGHRRPLDPREPVEHVSWFGGRRVRPLGGRPAPHGGRVGEGRAARPRQRPLAPPPLGGQPARGRAREPRPRRLGAGAGGLVPGGGVRVRRRGADRRRLRVDLVGLHALSGVPDVPVRRVQ